MNKIKLEMPDLLKAQTYAKELFADMQGDPNYPFSRWEEQYEEVKKLLEAGNLSMQFINFAVGAS